MVLTKDWAGYSKGEAPPIKDKAVIDALIEKGLLVEPQDDKTKARSKK